MPSSERTYQSVWARPPRKERPGLSREQIVTEALRILDADGIDALSMRNLSAALGVGTTSLYWHVTNRDELLELVIDRVHSELHLPPFGEGTDWKVAVRQFADSVRATGLRHTWLVSTFEQMVAAFMGPNQIRVGEHMIKLFGQAGFPSGEADRAFSTVTSYVTGVAMAEAAWHSLLARRGLSHQDWADEAVAAANQASDGRPVLQEVMENYKDKDPRQAMDEDFADALDRILDGLQARLDSL
jgi:AcrR family transcriptional regulator